MIMCEDSNFSWKWLPLEQLSLSPENWYKKKQLGKFRVKYAHC